MSPPPSRRCTASTGAPSSPPPRVWRVGASPKWSDFCDTVVLAAMCLKLPMLRSRGQNHRAVVLGELVVGALESGLVAARDDDPALELIADQRGRDAAEEREGALVA